MSTDTMYFNSSRLMSTAGKNKSNYLQKPDKKLSNTSNIVRKQQLKHDVTVPETLPQPQALPNGEKPNFGNASNKKSNSKGQYKKNRGQNYHQKKNEDSSADDLTNDLKQLLSVSEGEKERARESQKEKRPKSNATQKKYPKEDKPVDTRPAATKVGSDSQSGIPKTQQLMSPQVPSISPLPLHPGLYQQPPLNSTQQCAGYPYGNKPFANQYQQPNYALTSNTLPHLTTPAATLMNFPLQAMQPAPPTPPMHYHPQMNMSPHPINVINGHIPHNYAPIYQPNYPTQVPMVMAVPGLPPTSSGSVASNSNASTTPATSKRNKRKPSGGGGGSSSSGGYAGASFTTHAPTITNLPKPSFA